MAQTTSERFLDGRDRERLRQALSTAALARVYRRLEALLLIAEGHSLSEAARRVRGNRSSVHRWLARYLERHDPIDLLDASRSGRPAQAVELRREGLSEILATDPRTLGYAATGWTVPLLTQHLRRQGVQISERTLRRRLHQMGYRWKRPRYRYVSRPGKAERAGKKGLSSAA